MDCIVSNPKVIIEKYKLSDIPKNIIIVIGTEDRTAYQWDLDLCAQLMREVLDENNIKVISYEESKKTPTVNIPHKFYNPSTIDEVRSVIDGMSEGDLIVLKEGDSIRYATPNSVNYMYDEAVRILEHRRKVRAIITHHAFQMKKAVKKKKK